MTGAAPPAGWYPDPAGSGGQRYFDGTNWTGHVATPAFVPAGYGYQPNWQQPWKRARYGLPLSGPGSLASPGIRLGAFALDVVIFVPVFAVLAAIAIAIVAPHAGPLLPKVSDHPNQKVPFPGIFWIYLAIGVAGLVNALHWFLYQAMAAARYGRTLGKAWVKIRPVRLDGGALGTGACFGRAAIFSIALAIGTIGLVDPLWCLWDDDRQCLHDKAADSLVIYDNAMAAVGGTGGPVGTAAPAPSPPPTSASTSGSPPVQ